MSKITKNTKFTIIDDRDVRCIHAYHLSADEAIKMYNKLTDYECKTIEQAFYNTEHHRWMLVRDSSVFEMF